MPSLDFRTMIFTDAPRKTRADYANLPTREIFRLIAMAETGQETADTDHEWFDQTFALQELRAVLRERHGEYRVPT